MTSISLPTYSEAARGSLTVAESGGAIPFPIARIFYIYGLNEDYERGAHAHRKSEQVFIAISGSFSLTVTNADETKIYMMKEPNFAVYVPPMIWARIHDFSQGAVCLVLTNTAYNASDYIRDWREFMAEVGKA